MPSDDEQLAKLRARWEKTHAVWKKTSKRSQDVISAYHWNMRDDRAEWNRVLAARMREAIAFRKADAAHQMLVDFRRSAPSHEDSE